MSSSQTGEVVPPTKASTKRKAEEELRGLPAKRVDSDTAKGTLWMIAEMPLDILHEVSLRQDREGRDGEPGSPTSSCLDLQVSGAL
jgi:hypothetical protein